MRPRPSSFRSSALLLAWLVAAPAGAIDSLSGVWEGKFTCDSTSPTDTSVRQKADATLYVEDLGNGSGRARFNNATILPVPITVVSGADAPTSGRIAGVMCGFSADTGGALIQGLAKVKAGSEKGAMTGELIQFGGGVAPHAVSVCRFKVKRVGPLETPIGDCPP
jgi:hypothetical protein